MTDISIDSSKLPGVKEVCRDFAVLEDHSLAHTLQEQEIEHHLATNIQRNRLAKRDLKVAKQLQEEEDLKAQSQKKHRHTELEVLDGEIAQEIQEKLVIEAESRRRQEEKDEDIARLLQEREEKRRKKYNPPHGTEEPYYPDHGGHHRGRHKEHMSEFDRPHRHERAERRKEESHPKSEQRSRCADDDRKRGRSAEPRSGQGENPDLHRSENHISRTSDKKEKPGRPPPPRTNRHEQPEDKELSGAYSSENVPRKGRSQSHDLLSTNNADVRRGRHSPSSPSDRRGTGSANEPGKPRRRVDSDYENEKPRKRAESDYEHERPRRRAESDYEHERPRRRAESDYEHERPRRRAESEYEHERPRRRAESEYEHERHGKGAEGENEHEGHRRRAESKSEHEKHRRRTPSPNHERQPSDRGNRPKGHKDCPQGKLHIGAKIHDEDDAEIARRLQEEELRVNTVDYKTAQLAQDEEIARWLMEKEEKSYKKSKGREKERRRADEQESCSKGCLNAKCTFLQENVFNMLSLQSKYTSIGPALSGKKPQKASQTASELIYSTLLK
ncbi:coiled-coil domain-containing protein 50 isoform X2 [Rana temporaria]|uniref:coiled-coil domain-containing protein 50 isoform X2 n=1 Tax=Rana temporaria TaxID=8407 RepID=UPI001AAD4469|nr:coiled-coil domain-containing protein 50 isoform X2 [Rana temporaria]